MSFQGTYARNKTLHEESSAWRLLRADHAPIVLAFLDNLFSGRSEVPIDEARVSLDAEIRRMREMGLWDTETTGSTYLNLWIERGWLREMDERLTKTDPLDVALRFVQGLDTRTLGTSASHLRVVQEAVRNFAAAISPNVEDRLTIKRQQLGTLQAEVAALEAGEVPQLSEVQKKEGLREIFQLAHILPADFRLVEDQIRVTDQSLRVKMVQNEVTHGEILEEAMDQADLLDQTEAGGAFEGFYKLLSDDNRSMELRDHLRNILLMPDSKSFLTAYQHKFLAKLMRELTRESGRVFRVRARTGEALRAYVESGASRENRAVNSLLKEIKKIAVKLKDHDINIRQETRMTILAGKIDVMSPLAMRLKRPEEKIDASNITTAVNKSGASDDMLNILDTVNIQQVASEINELLQQYGPMTVGDLVSRRPITGGLEELVAYVRVAQSVQSSRLEVKEHVVIGDKNGNRLKATIPSFLMTADMFPHDLKSLAL